jgi:tetratricopeptide (TPR) repeat protein
LRAHAKWVFVFLAVVFMVSFVIFGVGSGSTGIGDVLQNFFSRSSSSGPSISKLQTKTRENPKDAKSWRDLSTALQTKNRPDEAITALTRYTDLKPKDQTALQQLGTLYLTRADTYAQDYVAAQSRSEALAPGASFKPQSSSPLSQVFQDPISTAVTTAGTTKTGEAYSKYIQAQNDAVGVYKKLVAANPKDATNQYRLGTVAQSAGDSKTAIAAYKKFLELAPNDALAPTAKQALKQLSAPATPKVSTG